MHTDGWKLVELEDGSSSSSDPEDQVLTELLHKSSAIAMPVARFITVGNSVLGCKR